MLCSVLRERWVRTAGEGSGSGSGREWGRLRGFGAFTLSLFFYEEGVTKSLC